MPGERQPTDLLAVIAGDPRRREIAGGELECGGGPASLDPRAEPIGKAIELQSAAGAARALGDQRQRLCGRVPTILVEEQLDPVFDRCDDGPDQLMAQPRREEFGNPKIDDRRHRKCRMAPD